MSNNDEHRDDRNGPRETLEERQIGYLIHKHLSDIEVPDDLVPNIRERVGRYQARREKFRRWWPAVAVPLVAAALTAIIMSVTGRSLEAPGPGRPKDPYQHFARKGKGQKKRLNRTLKAPKPGVPEDSENMAARKEGKRWSRAVEKGLKDVLKMLQAPGKVGSGRDGGEPGPGDGGRTRDSRRRQPK